MSGLTPNCHSLQSGSPRCTFDLWSIGFIHVGSIMHMAVSILILDNILGVMPNNGKISKQKTSGSGLIFLFFFLFFSEGNLLLTFTHVAILFMRALMRFIMNFFVDLYLQRLSLFYLFQVFTTCSLQFYFDNGFSLCTWILLVKFYILDIVWKHIISVFSNKWPTGIFFSFNVYILKLRLNFLMS